MMMNKPNQIIDEITGVIYPPAEAVVEQLNTIRAIIPPTTKIYNMTGDIHTIQPNLDMIQRAVDYLRGAPPLEFPNPEEPEPEEPVEKDEFFLMGKENCDKSYICIADFSEDVGKVLTTIVLIGEKLIPVNDPEMFGEQLPEGTTVASVKFPTVYGRKYHIQQINPALAHYSGDPTITGGAGQPWVKKKDYVADAEDEFEYLFLIPAGENKIVIQVYDLEADELIRNYQIYSEVTFDD